MLEKRLEVSAEGKKVYDIVIENSFSNLAKELSALDIQERKLCIVTERRVASYYLEEVKSILEGRCAKVEVYIFQEGEASKNLSTVDNLYHFLITHEFDRKDMLLALGGESYRRSDRICCCYLSAGNRLRTDSYKSARTGGQQYRRKNRSRLSCI